MEVGASSLYHAGSFPGEKRPDQGNERVGIERLPEIAARPGAASESRRGNLVMGGDEDDRRYPPLLGEPILQVEATQHPQVHVEDDALRIANGGALEKFFGRGERLDPDSIHAKCTRERTANWRVIVDAADPRFCLASRGPRRGLL